MNLKGVIVKLINGNYKIMSSSPLHIQSSANPTFCCSVFQQGDNNVIEVLLYVLARLVPL